MLYWTIILDHDTFALDPKDANSEPFGNFRLNFNATNKNPMSARPTHRTLYKR